MKKYWPLVVMGVLIVVYYAAIFTYFANSPVGDDYATITLFLERFHKAACLPAKLSLLFSQWHEHRIVFTRLIVLAQAYFFKTTNFAALKFTGNLSVLGIFLLLGKLFTPQSRKLLYFLPAAFFLFQPLAHENMYVAMAGLQNFGVVLFAVLAFYFLAKKNTLSFVLSLFFFTAATFTSGNGMFVFFIGLIPLAKDLKKLTIWGIAGITLIALYFHGYTQPALSPVDISHLNFAPASFFNFLSADLQPLYTFLIPNSPFLFGEIIGIAFCAYFAWLFWRGYYRKNGTICLIFLFICISGLLTTVIRHLGPTIVSRYTIYSTLLFIIVYISLADILPEDKFKKVFWYILAFAIFFNLSSYYLLVPLRAFRALLFKVS